MSSRKSPEVDCSPWKGNSFRGLDPKVLPHTFISDGSESISLEQNIKNLYSTTHKALLVFGCIGLVLSQFFMFTVLKVWHPYFQNFYNLSDAQYWWLKNMPLMAHMVKKLLINKK